MSQATAAVVRKLIALGSAAMMVGSLSAIAVVRADHRNRPSKLAAGNSSANQSLGLENSTGGGGNENSTGAGNGNSGEGLSGATGSGGAASGPAAATKS